MKLILTENHRTLGPKGTEIELPKESAKIWIESGKAKVPGKEKKEGKNKDKK